VRETDHSTLHSIEVKKEESSASAFRTTCHNVLNRRDNFTYTVIELAAYDMSVSADVLICKIIHKLLQVTETVKKLGSFTCTC
jgi:hypothetical protein